MQRDMREAAIDVTAKPNGSGAHVERAGTRITLGYVERDFRQSDLDLDAATGNPHSMRAIPYINDLVTSGGLYYDIYETGGGTVEGDTMRGRHHVSALEHVREDLSDDIGFRPLKRGIYLLGRHRRNPQDMALANDILSRAAQSDQGTPELEKIFDAQNRPEKILAALIDAQRRYDAGLSNGVEIAMCFSARKRFDDAYYDQRIDAIMQAIKGFTCVKATGIKDTVGYVRGEVDEAGNPLKLSQGNAALLTQRMVAAMEKLHEEQGYGPTTFTGHWHDSGYGNDGAVASIDAFCKMPRKYVDHIRMDELPGDNGFPDAEVFIPRLNERGLLIPMPKKWIEARAGIKRSLKEMAAPYGDKSKNRHWTGEQLRRGGCAIGSQGPFYRMYVSSIINQFIQANGADVQTDADKARAATMIKGVAMIFNGWLGDQTAWHAITPAADLLNQMAGAALQPDKSTAGMLQGMLQNGKLLELFKDPQFDPWAKDDAWWEAYINDNKIDQYIRSAKAADYARDAIPVEGGVKPVVLDRLTPDMKEGVVEDAKIIGPDAIAFADKMMLKIEQERLKPEVKAKEQHAPYFPSRDDIILMYLCRFDADASDASQKEMLRTFERAIFQPEHTYPLLWLPVPDPKKFAETASTDDKAMIAALTKNSVAGFAGLYKADPNTALQFLSIWQVTPEKFTRDWGMARYLVENRAPQWALSRQRQAFKAREPAFTPNTTSH